MQSGTGGCLLSPARRETKGKEGGWRSVFFSARTVAFGEVSKRRLVK
jgi:hypothetical protein